MSSPPQAEPESSTREVLAGLVERVTFHNAENGFCVLRIKARGHRELITVIGHAAVIAAGEWVTASGEWVNDRTHGQQFKSRFMRTSAPTSIEGIEKYLGSGMIRGIGPVYAKKMVKAFGATRPREMPDPIHKAYRSSTTPSANDRKGPSSRPRVSRAVIVAAAGAATGIIVSQQQSIIIAENVVQT